MASVRNILFVMCDQLRADYLSCMGHPTLQTPHIDALAKRGVLFDRAYCQAPVCGPSRMSFYTGRYVFSHGSTWNGVPLDIGELTLGDYLRPLGLRTVLVGKTHMSADTEGMARVELDPASPSGTLISECGFEPYARDDGLHPAPILDPDLPYNRYLRDQGYPGENPWQDYANSAEGPDGEILSGWHLRNARRPARVKEEHSETAYTTDRAMAFIDEAGDEPWCLHLSYIKPHWPYIAPAPYHDMYGPNQIQAPNRHLQELMHAHPVFAAFTQREGSRSFAHDQVRQTVIPAYMGLVKQIDDHVGRLVAFLEQRGRMADTLIVFTSDHGDYLGDHWMGGKELFHEESVRIPLIVYDPDPSADATRATVDSRLAAAIDLIPTFIDALGAKAQPHRLEGQSLLPLVRGDTAAPSWRDAVFSEADYAFSEVRRELGRSVHDARAFMVRTAAWKYVLFEGYRPQLFDLREDPGEIDDLGASPAHAAVRAEMHEHLFAWLRQRRTRRTISENTIERRTANARKQGILIGVW